MTNFFWARDTAADGCLWVRAEAVNTTFAASLPRTVVHCNGVFDLLHASHMRLLTAARKRPPTLVDGTRHSAPRTLVVTMDSDRLVRAQKGPGRPVMTWVERAAAIAHFHVDILIEIDSPEEYERVVTTLDPDLLVTGSDKLSEPDRFPHLRSMVVQDHGMRTTDLIRRCAKSLEASNGDKT